MTKLGKTNPKVVFRLGHLGDVVLTTGVLSYWHEKSDDTFIFITRAGNASLLDNHPAIKHIVGLDDDMLKGAAWLKESRRLAGKYKDHSLLDLHCTLRSRLLSLCWKGPVHRYPKFGLARRLYDKTHAQRYRTMLEASNVPQRYAMATGTKPPRADALLPRIFLSNEERTKAQAMLSKMSNGKPLIALHPYATHPAKTWPREHWQNLTGLLAGANMDWFIVGRNEKPIFANHDRDLTNKTSLRETCALMEKADLLITGDSGPMHLGCGVDTPVLAFFGPTSKAWGFYPAGPDDRVLELPMDCRPCSLHGAKNCTKGYECMLAITPENVMKTVHDMVPC
ncbi:MAG: glycosyltransferase family 9 protein [Pseudodesulfovibrio sp.]|nr:glycosyltransferase family 9 protein [Pseudodesulfovibrio sp.]